MDQGLSEGYCKFRVRLWSMLD